MILLTQPQQALPPGGTTPVYQNWGPTPQTLNLLYNQTLGQLPNPFNINFNIKDVYGTPDTGIYDELQLVCLAHHENYPSFFEWLNIVGLPSLTEPTTISENNLQYYCNFTFNNLPVLVNGNYSFKITFVINGIDSNLDVTQLSIYEYTINLAVTSNTISFSPSSIMFEHIQNTAPLPSKTITMYGNNWTLAASMFSANGAKLNLSTIDSGVTFGTDILNGESVQFAQGSGTKNIQVTLDTFYNTPNVPALYLSGNLGVFAGTSLISGIPFTVNVYNPNEINVSPDTLSFFALKGIQEPATQTLSVNIATAFTLTNSAWLIAIVNADGNYDITPIPTVNMSAGTYSGFVKFSAIISGVPIEKTIAVSYVLQEFVVNPYVDNRMAFTLDQDYFEFYSNNANTYFQINANVRCFDFFSANFKDYLIPQKLVLFQGKEKMNFGQSIHKIMNRYAAPNNSSFQYLPAILSLKVQEKLQSDDTLVRQTTLPDIKYIAGIGSLNSEGNFLLDFNLLPNSVKRTSFFHLNMFLHVGNFNLEIFKNGIAFETIPLPYSYGQISTHKLSFENFNQGDIIEVTLSDNSLTGAHIQYQRKKFYVLIPGPQSNFIQWENEFLLQSVLELTGEYALKTDIEVQSNKIYQNLVERLEHISNTTALTFSINTGWLINSDVDTIESLMRSKRIWITNGNQYVELRPGIKTLIKQDTQREFIEYALEFTINKSSNEKTYSF